MTKRMGMLPPLRFKAKATTYYYNVRPLLRGNRELPSITYVTERVASLLSSNTSDPGQYGLPPLGVKRGQSEETRFSHVD